MLEKFKNLKIVKKLSTEVSPKLRWLKFALNKKNNLDYVQSVSGVDLESMNESAKLEAMVRAQLKEEFPNIESMKSYELLVDAVMHNLRKKQLDDTL